MAETTGIEWADHTFNPWIGCTKVSPACDYCYAEALADKRLGIAQWGNHPRHLTSAANWKQPLKWNRAAQRDGVRRKVFCASLADVFDNQVPPGWRANLWALIAECTALDWLLLTKRPQNIKKMLPSTTCEAMIAGKPWPWPHVWLGTTVENQPEADRRIPDLLATPAATRFLSCEPLLSAVDLGRYLYGGHRCLITGYPGDHPYACGDCDPCLNTFGHPKPRGIDWTIIGGESGPNARPMNIAWAESLVLQCRAAGVAPFVKQLGARPLVAGLPYITKGKKGGDWFEWPEPLRVREFPT